MAILMIILGASVVLLTMLDFLLTTISLRREGPMTHAVSRTMQAALRHMGMRIRHYGGPITLTIIAGAWIVALWIGWMFVFYASSGHLTGPSDHPVIGFWDTLAFAGSTLSSMGLGVVTPTASSVHLATVLAAVSGILVLTLSVTYVLNVSQVASASRSAALQLRDLIEVLDAATDDADRTGMLFERFQNLGSMLHALADQRDSFPLARLYEVEGSHRDVAQRANTLKNLMEDRLHMPALPSERVQLEQLSQLLDRLTRG